MMMASLQLSAQHQPSSKKPLKQLIKEGTESNFIGIYTLITCNEDSLFFKSDTIHLYDNAYYFNTIGICCEFVEWEFSDDDLIRQQQPQTCLDPPSMLTSDIHYYKYRITKHKRRAYLRLYTKKDVFESYLVENIEYFELPGENNCRHITLIRIK